MNKDMNPLSNEIMKLPLKVYVYESLSPVPWGNKEVTRYNAFQGRNYKISIEIPMFFCEEEQKFYISQKGYDKNKTWLEYYGVREVEKCESESFINLASKPQGAVREIPNKGNTNTNSKIQFSKFSPSHQEKDIEQGGIKNFDEVSIKMEESFVSDDWNEEDDDVIPKAPSFQDSIDLFAEENEENSDEKMQYIAREKEKVKQFENNVYEGEDFEEESNNLEKTRRHIERIPSDDWLMEFNQSQDPTHIQWRNMINHGNDDQSNYYEEKRDNYIDSRKTRIMNEPYKTSMIVMEDDTLHKYYIGQRDVFTYNGENKEDQIVFHEHSPIGERYLEFNYSSRVFLPLGFSSEIESGDSIPNILYPRFAFELASCGMISSANTLAC